MTFFSMEVRGNRVCLKAVKIIVLILIGVFLASSATAATDYLDPNSDIQTGWTCTGGTCPLQYSVVDDGIREPNTPNTGDYISATVGGGTEISEVGFPTPAVTPESMTLWVYSATGSNAHFVFELRQAGNLRCDLDVATNSPAGWRSCTWSNPTGDYSALSNYFGDCEKIGGGANTQCYAYASYLEITYTDNPPSVTLVPPSPGNGVYTKNTSVTVNASVTDDFGVSSCTLQFDGVNSSMAQSGTGTSEYCSLTQSTLTEGIHSYRVFANDTLDQWSSSELRSFTVDTTEPSVTEPRPEPGSDYLPGETVTLSANITDASPFTAEAVVELPNSTVRTLTLTQGTGDTYSTSFDVPRLEGRFNVTFNATDSAGNFNDATTTYFRTLPLGEFLSPADGGKYMLGESFRALYNVTFNEDRVFSATYGFNSSEFSATDIGTDLYDRNITLTNTTPKGFRNLSVNLKNSLGTTFAQNTTRILVVSRLSSIYPDQDPIKGGDEQIVYPRGVEDSANDALNFYCSETTTTPTSADTVCKEGDTTFSSPYDNMQCSFDTAVDDVNHTVNCRVYDGSYYSKTSSVNYTTDSTPPSLTVDNVAGDTSPTYIDNLDDGFTNITVSGEEGMRCRFSSSDVAYSDMSSVNECPITGSTAECPAQPSQGYPDFYVSCRDSLGNENDGTNNADIESLLVDWTAPTTTDNSTSGIHLPNYTVNITERDNVDLDPSTFYCIDSTDSCSPSNPIDDGGLVTFDSTFRGTNFFRYFSEDDADNVQSTVSRTVIINSLPVFGSASDNATTIGGGSYVKVSTVSSDEDTSQGQSMSLFVCDSAGADATGCTGTSLCSNTTVGSNLSCVFQAPDDSSSHDWYAYIFDELGEAAGGNPKSGSYTTDSTGPGITINDPGNTTYTQSDVPASVTTNESTYTAYFSVDGGSNVSMSQVSSNEFSDTISGLSDGLHSVKFYALDLYDNVGVSETRYFTVSTATLDTTPPSLSAVFPTEGSYVDRNDFYINITADENLSSAVYSADGGPNLSMSSSSPRDWYSSISRTDGNHLLEYWGDDLAGNTGYLNVSYTVDSTAPKYSNVDVSPNPAEGGVDDVKCSAFWEDQLSNLSSLIVGENSSGSFVNHTVPFSGSSSWSNHTISSSDLSVGGYECRFFASDERGHTNSTSTSFTVEDTVPPVLSVVSPGNTTYATDSVTAEFTSDEATVSGWYSLDGGSNVSMNQVSSTRWRSTVSGLSDGQHVLRYYANDSSGNVGTATRYFSVQATAGDTTPPSLNIIYPVNGSFVGATDFFINISSDENVSNANYSLDGSANLSMDNSSVLDWYAGLTGLAEGLHSVKYWADDLAGNTGTLYHEFSVDVSGPKYSDVAVSPNPAEEGVDDVKCSAFWEDSLTNISSLVVGENASGTFENHSVSVSGSSGWSNYTIASSSLEVNGYSCRFFATDDVGNSNSTSASFTVEDTVPPDISISFPENKTYSSEDVPASISTSEPADYAWYSLDGASNVTMNKISGTSFSDTFEGLSDGFYGVRFFANDSSGNIGSSVMRYFTVDAVADDTTPPSLTVFSPLNNSFYSENITFNISSNEELSYASYSLDGQANVTMDNYSRTNWNSTVLPSNGVHSVIFYGEDLAGNIGRTSKRYFTFDNRSPEYSDVGVSSPVWDNSSASCFSFWTDNIELETGVIGTNVSGGMSNSTFELSGQTSWLNRSFDSSELSPGRFVCRFWVNDTSSNMNSSSVEFDVLDKTPPRFSNFVQSPSDEDDVDPGRVIDFNVTVDDHNVSEVLLQYRNSSSNYTNISMTNPEGSIYSGSFTPLHEDNYSYRYYSIDDAGNQNFSDTFWTPVFYERRFELVDDVPDVLSRVVGDEPIMDLGDIGLNNTGDKGLNFSVSGDRSWIRFNGSQSLSELNVSEGKSEVFIVTANTTNFGVGGYSYNITITADINGSMVDEKYVSGTVNVQNEDGPVLDIDITEFSSQVAKGQSGVEYRAEVTNIGTQDAEDAWLGWDVPSQFTVSSGTLNRSLGDLIIGGSGANSITVRVKENIDDAEVNITALSGSSNSKNVSDTRTVTIGDPETVTETVGGGSGGGSSGSTGGISNDTVDTILSGERILNSTDSFDLVIGNRGWFPVEIGSIFESASIVDIDIRLEGFLADRAEVRPAGFSEIPYGEGRVFNVSVDVPEYFEPGTHVLNAIVTGRILGEGINQSFVNNRRINIVLQRVSKEEANGSIYDAESILEGSNFSGDGFESRLEEARRLFEQGEFDSAKSIADEVVESIKMAERFREDVEKLDERVSSETSETAERLFGINRFGRTSELISLARAAFERGDYRTALDRLNEAELAFRSERSGFVLGYFLVRNWLTLLAGVLVSVLFVFYGRREYLKRSISRRIEELDEEEDRLLDNLVEYQRKYYVKESIGEGVFKSKKSSIENSIEDIEETRTSLRSKRRSLLPLSQALEDVGEERERVVEEIKELQKKYYKSSDVGEMMFSTRMDNLSSRLTEIEKEDLALKLDKRRNS